jgi:lipoprotein-releasing system permease protein
MFGIALGVMVLITVLSVMNGFDLEIHQRFFGMAPEITVNGEGDRIANWQAMQASITNTPGVTAVAPFVGGQGLIAYGGQIAPILLNGIEPGYEEAISHLREKMILGDGHAFNPFGMIIGRGLAENLGVMLGDQVTVMVPQATVTPAGVIPRFKRFTIQGIFAAGAGFGFESRLAYVSLPDAQKLLQMPAQISGFKVKIHDIYAATTLGAVLTQQLGDSVMVSDWTQQFGAFFHAVKMEKSMMFLILLLIIAVAAFNLVSSLVMVVNDKQAEIAILRTLGAPPRFILSVFMIQGMLVGVFGTALGLVAGVLLASNATLIINTLQSVAGIQLMPTNVYWVDYLPVQILYSDLFKVCTVALCMSFLATCYPAWRASRTVIATALHYE